MGNTDTDTKDGAKADTKADTGATYTKLDTCFLCGKPADPQLVCDKCGLVAACSEAHLKLHRPEGFCFPWMVEQRAGVGRYVVAVRDIAPLELVMWDSAACLGPRMGCAVCCLQCLKPVDGSYRCPRCGWPMCDETCAGGKAHMIECSTLSQYQGEIDFSNTADTHDHYRAIAPLRLMKVKEKVPEVWERLGYLMDHNEDRVKEPELWATYQRSVNTFLGQCDPALASDTAARDLDRCVGLLWTNAFACSNGGGQAIFPTFSFMSHSCAPNCGHSVFPNKTLALQAKHEIKAGEEFTISYISPLQGSLKRRSKLHDKWFFDCNCPRCASPTELDSFTSVHLCPKCQSPEAYLLPEDVADDSAAWRCVVAGCGHTEQPAALSRRETEIAQQMQGLDNFKVVQFEELHESLAASLHPNHYLMVLLKRHMVGLYSTVLPELATEDLERVKRYCEEVDSVYQIIDPGYQKERGTILRALCEVSKLLAKKHLNAGTETEDQFSARVKLCVQLFQEAQKCMFVRLKKDQRTEEGKYVVVTRKDPVDMSN